MSSLSDLEFLEASEINFFLEQLLHELAVVSAGPKGEDVNEYSCRFFQKVLSCTHVIGMSFAYSSMSNYNRRALVCCAVEAFMCFPPLAEISILEAVHLLRVVCGDFPRQLIEDAVHPLLLYGVTSGCAGASSGTGPIKKSTQLLLYSNNPRCLVVPLQSAIYVCVIYEHWLRLVERFFASLSPTPLTGGSLLPSGGGGSGCGSGRTVTMPNTLSNVHKLAQKLNQWRNELPRQIVQPHKDAVDGVLRVLTNAAAAAAAPSLASGPSSSGGVGGIGASPHDLPFDFFRKELSVHPVVVTDVFRRPLHVVQQQQQYFSQH